MTDYTNKPNQEEETYKEKKWRENKESAVDLNVTEESNQNDHAIEDAIQNIENIEIDEKQKISELELKVAELKDLYVRAQAEMQNLQKRSIEDVKKARDYSISGFAKDMIVIRDYLEMALKDQSGNFDTLKMGVDLTLKQLIQVFERHLIKEIEVMPNDKLDPHIHQAMEAVEKDGIEANTIVDIKQKGYKLQERVLRPAMVTVAK